jgi:hypothetical protein
MINHKGPEKESDHDSGDNAERPEQMPDGTGDPPSTVAQNQQKE